MGLINAAFDAADNIAATKEQNDKRAKAKALAKKKANEATQNKDNFSLF